MSRNGEFVISILCDLNADQVQYIIDCWVDYVHNDLDIDVAKLPILYTGAVLDGV